MLSVEHDQASMQTVEEQRGGADPPEARACGRLRDAREALEGSSREGCEREAWDGRDGGRDKMLHISTKM